VLAARHLEHEHAHEVRVPLPRAQQDLGDLAQLLTRRVARLLDAFDRLDQRAPRLAEDGAEHLLLRAEVVVQEAVRDARLLGDVADAARVVPLPGEDAHRRVQKQSALFLLGLRVRAVRHPGGV
jgi:hypothetical protein